MSIQMSKVYETTHVILNAPNGRWGYRNTQHGIVLFDAQTQKLGPGYTHLSFIRDGVQYKKRIDKYLAGKSLARQINIFVTEATK